MKIKDESFHNGKLAVIDGYEQSWLMHMAKMHGTNISEIARLGELDRTSVYRLMSKHGFDRSKLQTLSDPLGETS